MHGDASEGMIKWDGLDDAVIGKSTSGQLVYDINKVIHVFMDRDGMDYEEANDFFWFNVEGSRSNDNPDSPIHVFVGEVEELL